MSEFADSIERNKVAGTAPTNFTSVEYRGGVLHVRNRGAVVLGASFHGVDLLAPTKDIGDIKPAGSFACYPFGATKQLGGQHGYPRYAHFTSQTENRQNGATIVANADETVEVPSMRRIFDLGKSLLRITTKVTNRTGQMVTASLAEHPYFPLPTGDAGDLRINERDLDAFFGAGAIEDVNNGISRFKLYLGGPLEVSLPTLRFSMLAFPGLHGLPTEAVLGLVAWKRPEGHADADTICLEPTLGVQPSSEGLFNEGLIIPSGAAASLTTEFAAIQKN